MVSSLLVQAGEVGFGCTFVAAVDIVVVGIVVVDIVVVEGYIVAVAREKKGHSVVERQAYIEGEVDGAANGRASKQEVCIVAVTREKMEHIVVVER